MEIIDRYLGAVRWNLPAAQADDIVAELRDLIAARIEDREDALDRPLRRDEVSALLREFGHPISVAANYRPQQWLIGPDVFPFYWFILKIVAAVALLVEAVQVVTHSLFAGRNATQAVMQAIHGMGSTLLVNAALVTLIFALIERTGWIGRYFERWQPEDLPAFRLKAPRAQRWEPAFEAAVGIAFLLWWSAALPATMVRTGDASISVAPIWAVLHWPIFALVAASVFHNLVRWLRPEWRAMRGMLAVVTTAAGLAILGLLYQAGRLVTVVPARATPAEVAEMQSAIDQAMPIALGVIAVIWIFKCGQELWRVRGRSA